MYRMYFLRICHVSLCRAHLNVDVSVQYSLDPLVYFPHNVAGNQPSDTASHLLPDSSSRHWIVNFLFTCHARHATFALCVDLWPSWEPWQQIWVLYILCDGDHIKLCSNLLLYSQLEMQVKWDMNHGDQNCRFKPWSLVQEFKCILLLLLIDEDQRSQKNLRAFLQRFLIDMGLRMYGIDFVTRSVQ